MSKTAVMIGAAAAALAFAGAGYAQQAPDRASQALARMQGGPFGGRMAERAMQRGGMGGTALLRAADANQDGVATRAEVDALLAEEFAFRDRTGDGVIDEADLGPTARRMAELRPERTEDPWAAPRRGADADRAVTRDDMLARAGDLFTRLDADADGSITAEEAREARPGRRGDRGGQP